MEPFTGVIEVITDVEEFGKNNTSKCTVAVKSTQIVEYPPSLAADLIGDKVEMYLKEYNIEVGDEVALFYTPSYRTREGKDGETKVMHSNRIWKIEVLKKANDDDSKTSATAVDNSDGEDLPF